MRVITVERTITQTTKVAVLESESDTACIERAANMPDCRWKTKSNSEYRIGDEEEDPVI